MSDLLGIEASRQKKIIVVEPFGPVWAWDEDYKGTQVQSMMVYPCPDCQYPYCQTEPIYVFDALKANKLGDFVCPRCGWRRKD